MATGIQSIYYIKSNNQEVEVTWIVKNKSATKAATNVVSTFTIPTGVTYVSNVVAAGHGTYNPGTHVWTLAKLYPGATKTIKVKYKVTNTSYLNTSLKQETTITEDDDLLDNNERVVYFMKEGDTTCDPCAFTTPVIAISDDTIYERVYIGDNDSVECACCTKTYELVDDSSINITVVSFNDDGYANIIRTDPATDSYFDYRVVCTDCVDGNDYSSVVSATVKVNKLFSWWYKEYEANLGVDSGGNDPSVYILRNTLGGAVTWTRSEAGKYIATKTGAFTQMATVCYATIPQGGGAYKAEISRINANQVGFNIFNTGSQAYVDTDLSDISVHIKVYIPEVIPTQTPSRTPSRTVTPTVTASVTPTISVSSSVTPSITVSPSVTPSISITPTVTPSISVSPSVTPSITVSSSITPSVTPSITVSSSITVSVTPSISVSPSISLSPSETVSVTPTLTSTPTTTPSVTPSISITPTLTPSPTPSRTPSPSA